MKQRPILFSGEMVRAILDGRKTQTRRIVKPQSAILTDEMARGFGIRPPEQKDLPVIDCPYGKPGDQLWLKETWKPDPAWGQSNSPTMEINEGSNILYRSTLPEDHAKYEFGKWRPSIFMRHWMSRITLEITAVRVERLQSITESDAVAEGVIIKPDAEIASRFIRGEQGPAQLEYFALWESINGKGSWEQNPWVWVIEFRKI